MIKQKRGFSCADTTSRLNTHKIVEALVMYQPRSETEDETTPVCSWCSSDLSNLYQPNLRDVY